MNAFRWTLSGRLVGFLCCLHRDELTLHKQQGNGERGEPSYRRWHGMGEVNGTIAARKFLSPANRCVGSAGGHFDQFSVIRKIS
jgi:hypothetical protein